MLNQREIEQYGWESITPTTYKGVFPPMGTLELLYRGISPRAEISYRNYVRDGSGRYTLYKIFQGYIRTPEEMDLLIKLLTNG